MKRNKKTAIFFNKLPVFAVGFLFLILNAISVNAQSHIEILNNQNLQFGNFANSGAGSITVSSDFNSLVSTSGGVFDQPGGTPQSALIQVTFSSINRYSSVSIKYNTGIKLYNGSYSISLLPDPIQTFSNPGNKNRTNYLLIYIGGTLTIGSTIMPAGNYTGNFTVFSTFNY